jgi:hypothetical protein
LPRNTAKLVGRICIRLRSMEGRPPEGLSNDALPYGVENHLRAVVEVRTRRRGRFEPDAWREVVRRLLAGLMALNETAVKTGAK